MLMQLQPAVQLYASLNAMFLCCVQDRATAKAKPMTATATNMVKAVWASYFKTAEQSGRRLHLNMQPY